MTWRKNFIRKYKRNKYKSMKRYCTHNVKLHVDVGVKKMLLLSVCESNFNTFLKLICDITQNIRVNTDCPKWKKKQKKHTDQVLITMNRFCYWSVQCFCLKRSHYICWQWLYEGKNFSFFSLLWKKTNKNQSCHFWHKQWYQLICTWFNTKEHLTYFQLTFSPCLYRCLLGKSWHLYMECKKRTNLFNDWVQ